MPRAGLPTPVPTNVARASIIKTINLLSTGRSIVQPTELAGDSYIYRIDMREVNWTAAAWTNVKATDPLRRA